jgi:RNA polymerase sigma-70 factor (ECF subfamily)
VNFDTLYREQRTRVLATVRSVIGPSDEIEDVVQLVFIEVHRSLDRFQGRSKLSTWVYRIAVNVALQHIRRKKRRRWLMLGSTGEEAERQPARGNSEHRLEGRELLEHVYRAAERLSEKKRTVWVLHELQGLSPPEVAETLEIPVNTVRSRLLAARREIRTWLERGGVLPVSPAAGSDSNSGGSER